MLTYGFSLHLEVCKNERDGWPIPNSKSRNRYLKYSYGYGQWQQNYVPFLPYAEFVVKFLMRYSYAVKVYGTGCHVSVRLPVRP